ncbi:hypothetical protein [Neolewinella antarctica]|uniref:Outer membrane protein beta-barrel domain-containing protein n=1 Tax=Neolewinella antarctica TaxID=442734 RepID=A0ABX0X7V8_9BACT|nr:hypothetical protein [Neolewinella antarctica]NJC25252.1 hypothetical protein [Neolewinella antarctica]
MRLKSLTLVIVILCSGVTLAQRDATGFHYGAQASALLVPFKGSASQSGYGGEVGVFGEYRNAGNDVFQAQIGLGTVTDLSVQHTEKKVFIGADQTIWRTRLITAGNFNYADLSLLFGPSWMKFKGFSVLSGLKLTRVLKIDASEQRSTRGISSVQVAALKEGNDIEFEALNNGPGGENSVSVQKSSRFTEANSKWVQGIVLRVDKRFDTGPLLFVQAVYDLNNRFTKVAPGFGQPLKVYQFGFQYLIK